MARVTLTLMEPLPPIDVDLVLKEIEDEYLNILLGARTKEVQWWEKSTALIWLSFFKVSSKYQIPLPPGTVRMIRATLLYDTLVLRLDHSIDLRKKTYQYRKKAGKAARKQINKAINRRLSKGLDDMDYLKLQEMFDLGNRILYRTQRLFDTLPFNSLAMISKPIFVLFEIFRFSLHFLITVMLVVMVVAGFQFFTSGSDIDLLSLVSSVFSLWWFQLLLLLLVFIYIRRIYLRLKDKD
jgi:hypothetical protein